MATNDAKEENGNDEELPDDIEAAEKKSRWAAFKKKKNPCKFSNSLYIYILRKFQYYLAINK